MRPASLPLSGGRWVPFVEVLRLRGIDLTGADFRMQIRLYPDAPGDPLLDIGAVSSAAEQGLRMIYAGSETIDQHVAAARLDSVPPGSLGGDTLTMTILEIRIFDTTMSGLPYPPERGDDNALSHDIHITPANSFAQTWFAGPFNVLSGVTK